MRASTFSAPMLLAPAALTAAQSAAPPLTTAVERAVPQTSKQLQLKHVELGV